MRDKIIEYLESQIKINEEVLDNYDKKNDPKDNEIVMLRELERIKLNDRILELKRHVEVIKVL